MRASFFDIDGTLVKGLMIYEFPKMLLKKGLFEEELFEEIDSWVNLYLENKTTYRKIALEIPGLYSKAIEGVRVDEVEEEAKKFVNFYIKKYIQPYTMELVKLMKTHGMTIGISGSPIEVVCYLGRIFNFDNTYGTKFEIKNGIYTGGIKQNMVIKETKEIILDKIIGENKIDLSKSFSFGDTEQDVPLLSRVGFPVTLNPNSNLLNLAKENGWSIFTSKDDVAYEVKKVLEENK